MPNLPPRDPGAPGQFRFADPSRVRGILEASGWQDIELRAIDVECTFPEADLLRYVTRLGPLGRMLQAADAQARERLLATVLSAFRPYLDGAKVRFSAACWNVCARAPAVPES